MTINPETKVGALLDAYPGIEESLIAWVPAFTKLKNPVLRRTVAKVATLGQAAGIAGVDAGELVRRIREVVGENCGGGCGHSGAVETEAAPEWVSEDRVRHIIDADAMLETGVHPIGKVRQCAAELRPGELLCLTSSFRPVPLIDTMRRGGLPVYSTEISPGRHATYIGAAPTSENLPR
jgi:hypothetical protein